MSWSGDVVQLTLDNKNLQWHLPESGGAIWTDNMLIPKGGDAFTASTYMNFVYRPEIAAQIAAYINYVSPVKGAKEAMEKIDPDLAANPLVFPDGGDARERLDLRLEGAPEPGLQRAVAGADRKLGCMASRPPSVGEPMVPEPPRRSSASPTEPAHRSATCVAASVAVPAPSPRARSLSLLAPGLLWLRSSSSPRSGSSATSRSRAARSTSATSSTGTSATTGTRSTATTST